MESKADEELSSDYPLGREREESAQLLFKFFCNNLYLGQWELASACISQLCGSAEYKQKIKDVLKDVIENPCNRSKGGDNLPSPHHLSWLCLNEYKNLSLDKTEIDGLDHLSRDVEFRLLLTEVCQSCTDPLLQELYLYHRNVWKARPASSTSSPGHTKTLSSAALTFLKETLTSKPVFGHAIFNAIRRKAQDSHRKQNEALETLYIECLYSLLEDISFSQLDVDDSESENDNKLQTLHTLISLYDPEPGINSKHLGTILQKLLLNCQEYGGKLHRYKLMSCLLGRSDSYLINEFISIDNNCRKEKLLMGYRGENIDDRERDLIAISLSEDRDVAWRALFTSVFEHRQHFLDCVIKTALEFIKNSKYSDLEQLFVPEELHPLKPLVLLLGWSHCYTLSDARVLLSLLWDDQNPCKTSVLEQGCNKLAYQVDLIEWCLQKTRPFCKAKSSSASSQQQRATDLFQSLESHSVLYVLHHAAKLSSLEEPEVLELLEKTPNHKETVNGSKFRRVVRFADEGEDHGNEVQSPPISLEQERDISIYRSYCALKKVMDAMKNCLDYAHLELMNPLQKGIPRKSSTTSYTSTVRGSSFSEDGNQTMKSDCENTDLYCGANFQEFYSQNIWQQLECAREQLAEVFPLTYRLEVLEDIFALLFMTHENIKETVQSDSESGEDGAEDQRNSLENLNVSMNSDEELITQRQDPLTKRKTAPNDLAFDFDEPFESIYRNAALKKSLSQEANKSSPNVHSKDRDRTSELKMSAQIRPRSPTVDSGQQISGASTMSTGSTTSLFRLGFMANEYVVRDVLQTLRDCLFDLDTTKFRLAGKDPDSKPSDKKPTSIRVDAHSEEMLTHVVPSTVTTDTLQKRMSRLTQYVSEAQWRFQLVAHPSIPRHSGEVLTEAMKVSESSSDEEFGEVQPEYEKRRTGRLPTRGQNSSDDAGETSQYSGYESTHHRRSRSSGRRKSVSRKSVTKLQSGIIPSMLSSYESLLCLSLKRGQQAQANQVVKMFNMEGRPEVAEVGFSAQYNDAVRKLHSFGSRAGREVSGTASKPGRVSMKMLANVAAAGMATASVSNITDDLLTSVKLPTLISPRNKDAIPGQLKDVFKEEQVPYLVLADLTLTSCRTWGLCNNLLQITKGQEIKVTVAAKPEIKAVDTRKSVRDSKLKGCSQFLDELQELVQFAISCEGPETTLADQLLTKKIIGNCPEVSLSLATHPLTVTGCRNLLAAIEILQKLAEKSQQVLVEKLSPKPLKEKSSSPSRLHGSPQSYSKQEQPVIHNAMKHLVHALEKHVPPGGFVVHYLRGFPENVPANRNYLLSLYDHVKELAFLVAECDAITKESIIVPTNYFRMLEEGPIITLGRLMFVKKMQPSKLEKVAQKLSLNLTHIIVHSCCPVVPSKWSPRLNVESGQIYRTEGGCVVLNHAVVWPGTMRHPETVVRNLLTKLLQLMKDIANSNNARAIFTPACAELTVQKDEYVEFNKGTQELKFVDLDLLKSREEKICFFSNVQNLLTMHSHLFQTWKQANLQQEGSCPMFDRSLHMPSIMDKVIQANSTGYAVGQLGVVSLFELKFVINRCGLHPPALWKKLLHSRLFVLDAIDPWYKYAPPPEPRLLFVTSDGCASSPPIQVLSPDMVLTQLHRSMKDFLNQTVTIDLEHKLVSIPELLVWYRRDFASERVDQFDAPNEGLVNFISTQVTGQTESQLIQLLRLDQVHEFAENIDSTGRKELPFSVKVRSFNQECQFSFDYESIRKQAQPYTKTHRRSVSLPPFLESSEESLSLGKAKEPSTYQLTPITLEYVKEDSPLCATLVSLICSDELDDIEEHLEDDYFTDMGNKMRKRTQSDISLVDIRSYRYHRLTDDYPILQRHLLNLVVPLAAAEDPDIVKSADPILKFVTSSISNKVKGCMLNLHGSRQYQTCLTAILNELFTAHDWKALHEILSWVPKMNLEETPELKILSDFMVSCLAYSLIRQGPVCSGVKSVFVAGSIRQIHGLEHQARIVLALVKYLPMNIATELVQLCLSHKHLSQTMQEALLAKMKELNIYHKIMLCVKGLQIKLAMASEDAIISTVTHGFTDLVGKLDQFLDWRMVQKAPKDEVLSVLLRASDFQTSRAWVNLHHLPKSRCQEIEEEYVIFLLSQNPPNTTEVFKSLEAVLKENHEVCYTMCDRLLNRVKDTANILFLTNFLLNHVTIEMSDLKLDELRQLNIGAKSLLCLPESIRGEYSHLVSTPKLLLEQLLMNMKADLAGQVFTYIKPDISRMRDSRLGLTTEQFDELLAMYGRKALEFPVVQVLTQDGDRSPSRTSPLVGGDEQGSLPKSSFLDSMRISTSRRSVDYTALNVNRPLMSTSLGASPNKKVLSPPPAMLTGKKFIMPPDPPPKDKWVPDTAVSVCMVCQLERFSMFNRRHHCRRCGRVICASCSTKTTVIKGVSSRTCDECYEQMFKPRLDQSRDEQESYQQRMKDSLSTSISPIITRAPPTSSASSHPSEGGDLGTPGQWNIGSVIRHTEHEWKLKTDKDHNTLLREEFYYEQAPSASLCISILSLLSNQSKAGQIMLELCDDLSKILRPIAPGVTNPEVDYSLVISMMKHLLFRAKMNYIESGEAQGLGMSDTYLSRVDLLNLLVSGNVSDIPSVQELTKVESVRRLRDRLIEDERLPLAMEVSTKCGLDPAGVWVAWGMGCLQCADYVGAREKFSRCLKAPVDRNLTQQTFTSKLINDIIDSLESMPNTDNTDVRSLLSSPGSLKSLMTAPPLRYVDESRLDKPQYEECVYYLKTYGSHLASVHFYKRNGFLKEAAEYILHHKCSSEVFMEGVLIPSLRTEDLGKLQELMILIDPTLERWSPHLTATCRYLIKSKLIHVLYQVQIFMKDFIRAAMTCVTYFFQRGSRSYLKLAGCVQYLFNAQHHLDAYLDPSKWGDVTPPSFAHTTHKPSWSDSHSATDVQSSSVRLIQTPAEVKRYLNTVILQIEVTKYMEKSLTAKPQDGTAIAVLQSFLSGKDPPATLFGNAKMRADVVNMVLMVGEDVLTSFDLSMKIIKEYKLAAVPILTHAAHEMAKFHDYSRIRHLLDCLKHAGLDEAQTVDEIIGACIIGLADDPAEAKEVDNLIKLLRMDSNKINAMILVGKLKSAYLLAVKSERVEDVQRISGAAQRGGQTSVKNICDKWLHQRLKKQ